MHQNSKNGVIFQHAGPLVIQNDLTKLIQKQLKKRSLRDCSIFLIIADMWTCFPSKIISFTQYILNQPYFFAGKIVGDTMQRKHTGLAKYLLEVEKNWYILWRHVLR